MKTRGTPCLKFGSLQIIMRFRTAHAPHFGSVYLNSKNLKTTCMSMSTWKIIYCSRKHFGCPGPHKTVRMKGSFLFTLVLIAAMGFTANACSVCGCGEGNVYMGLLPDFKYQFIGLGI